MAKLAEETAWVEDLYQLETDDPLLGGADGFDNIHAKQLGARTQYLKEQVEAQAQKSGTSSFGRTKKTLTLVASQSTVSTLNFLPPHHGYLTIRAYLNVSHDGAGFKNELIVNGTVLDTDQVIQSQVASFQILVPGNVAQTIQQRVFNLSNSVSTAPFAMILDYEFTPL